MEEEGGGEGRGERGGEGGEGRGGEWKFYLFSNIVEPYSLGNDWTLRSLFS